MWTYTFCHEQTRFRAPNTFEIENLWSCNNCQPLNPFKVHQLLRIWDWLFPMAYIFWKVLVRKTKMLYLHEKTWHSGYLSTCCWLGWLSGHVNAKGCAFITDSDQKIIEGHISAWEIHSAAGKFECHSRLRRCTIGDSVLQVTRAFWSCYLQGPEITTLTTACVLGVLLMCKGMMEISIWVVESSSGRNTCASCGSHNDL